MCVFFFKGKHSTDKTLWVNLSVAKGTGQVEQSISFWKPIISLQIDNGCQHAYSEPHNKMK